MHICIYICHMAYPSVARQSVAAGRPSSSCSMRRTSSSVVSLSSCSDPSNAYKPKL